MISDPSEKQFLSISQLNRRARLLLESHLSLLWVKGEISNLSRPGSGHWYFTLKDKDAQIRCAMFRNRNQLTRFKPRDGDQVLVRGRISLYEARGEYQLIVEHMEADGAGALQQQFEALKQKLLDEGLFRDELKRPLPAFPRRIGVITSATGAAVRDIIHVSARRHPWIELVIYPVAVQGKEATPQIVAAIAQANMRARDDLLIVARGGGSIEDLWAFNEEAVARAIHASAIPVISAVGHETDFTIADFVADVRAPTPSAAAEIAGPDMAALRSNIAAYEGFFLRHMRRVLAQAQFSLDALGKRLRSPADKLREQNQHLDHLEIRMLQAWHGLQERRNTRFAQLDRRFHHHLGTFPIAARRQLVAQLDMRIQRAMLSLTSDRRRQLQGLAATLHAVSPLNTLERGYAIARSTQGASISSVAQINQGDAIQVQVRDGSFDCQVTAVRPQQNGENQGLS